MAYNDRKILHVLQEEIDKVQNRCGGYRKEIFHLLGDVLNLEREHKIAKTNVVKQIADRVNAVGMFLHRESGRSRENNSTGRGIK